MLALSVCAAIAPVGATGSTGRPCGSEVFGRPGFALKAYDIRARHVNCALARKVARQADRPHKNGEPRFFYRWHNFRCVGVQHNPSQGLPWIRYHCRRLPNQYVTFKLQIP
jgi:hypothetical protein